VSVSAVVSKLANVSAARYTVCPSAKGTACKIGNLPTGQSDELLAAVKVARGATTGRKVLLTATATGQGATSFHAAASVLISATARSTSPSPTSPSSASGGTIPTLPVPSLPGLTGLPGTPGVPGLEANPGNPGSLFPTVTPGTPSPPATTQGAAKPHHINAVPASATLPLDPRLIGGQLAGLAVLLGAIVIAIARLSLRTQRTQESKASDS
jgi:hypothetical protein